MKLKKEEKMKKAVLVIISSFLFFTSCTDKRSSSTCPKKEELQKALNTFQPGVIIERIEKLPISDLCEVVVKFSEFSEFPEINKTILYTDQKGKYLFSGSIIELSTKKNLTLEKLTLLNKRVLEKEALAELEKVVAFTWGDKGPAFYFITDPDCPFCKEAESILEELVKAGKVTVKVILFPLEVIHPEAKAKAISIICDQKGYEGLKTGYKSKNQCSVGKQKIEKTVFLMKKFGIKGTPTYIFPDGEVKSGVMPAEAILQKLS